RFLTASGDCTARIWDSVTGTPVVPPMRHSNDVRYASFSSDGKRVLTVSADFTARAWDSLTAEPLSSPLQHSNNVVHSAFSPDGKRVVTVTEDHRGRVWDLNSGQAVTLEDGANGQKQEPWTVSVAVFSSDSRFVLTASSGADAFDAATGKRLGQVSRFGDGNRLCISSDGRLCYWRE